ncbi:MAG: hypothetical protein HPY66_0726 [Firmicutes bacterium]|nr:hypothetical protein [Bacillota bacterium]MDI6705659.1 metal-dependent hydrolase [Bacillota bacterium]
MDPLTHAVIGAGTYALSGGSVSISNPLFAGCIAGALVPDLDIVARLWNDYHYLRHHRGSSHSLAGMLPMSAATAMILSKLLPGGSFYGVLLWTYIGCLSHAFFDFFNSYGAQLFWPVSRKKYSLSVLKIFDFFIIIFFAAMLFYRNSSWAYKGIIILFCVFYFGLLVLMRIQAKKMVSRFFKGRVDKESVKILPSSKGFFDWDFIIISNRHTTVGKVHILRGRIEIVERLRTTRRDYGDKLMNNRVGKFFREFTPFFHVEIKKQSKQVEVIFTDLRYRAKNRFKHHATAVYNAKGVLEECIFHPFSRDNNVKF